MIFIHQLSPPLCCCRGLLRVTLHNVLYILFVLFFSFFRHLLLFFLISRRHGVSALSYYLVCCFCFPLQLHDIEAQWGCAWTTSVHSQLLLCDGVFSVLSNYHSDLFPSETEDGENFRQSRRMLDMHSCNVFYSGARIYTNVNCTR